MKRKFPTALVALAIGLAAVSGIAARSLLQSEGYRARLREVYDGAVLSALRQMEDLRLALTKAALSGDPGAESRYLGQAGAGAAQVQRSLSLLPLSHTATQGAVKFANQIADYTNVLLQGREMTEQDARRLSALAAACQSYVQALQGARDTLSAQAAAGADTFYAAADPEAPVYDSAVNYPTLIYDGPFSDAVAPGPARGLGQKAVSREEAEGIARDFLGAERVNQLSAGPDMGGEIPCWGVELKTADVTVHLAVTKTGGKVLWMAPDSADFPAERSLEECRESARTFLEERGFEGMESTFFQAYQGLMVISFAATQGNTLLYPDQVKVQLRMDTAQVVGLEARSYWQNHTARGLLIPDMTEAEAKAYVSPLLDAEEGRLCLIPTDGGEKLCWEFQGSYNGETYISYINAASGRQEELLLVVESETGLETV